MIKLLPPAMSHADPETLGFLSADRYPTEPAEDLARAHGLWHADVEVSLRRWSDHLVSREARRPPRALQRGLSTLPNSSGR